MTTDAVVEIDARGMRCPWPALRLARAMRSADRVCLCADDPAAAAELAALAAAQGWSIAEQASVGGARQWQVGR